MSAPGTYDVLILGYGPVGATLANLLGQKGHRVAVAEIHPQVFDKPRAVNLDQEALRVLQRIDLAQEISKGCAPHPGTDFLGADGELIKAIYSAPPPYPLGWPANLMFVQPEAEKKLRARVDGLTNVDVFLEHTAVAFDRTDASVTVSFDTPQGSRHISAKYLIGSDGANSPTRNWLGATQTDLGFSEHWVVVDAWLTRDTPLPPRTTQYCTPDGPTSYVICSDTLRRWELKILPGEDPADYNDIEKIKTRLAPFVDVDALKFWRSSVYLFSARVADTWRDGNVFLAGDAAHTMPPFLGQGLNSGMRDANNLAWKLSRVLNGKAPEGLLDSYQTERRPHIFALTEITKDLGRIIGEVDPAKAAIRDAKLRAEMAEQGPVTVRQSLIPPLREGFLDPEGGDLAGTLAPQPRVELRGAEFLLDDALEGFALVQRHASGDALEVTTTIDADDPLCFVCRDISSTMTGFLRANGITSLIMRPDGVVWSAAPDTKAAIARLRRALRTDVEEVRQ